MTKTYIVTTGTDRLLDLTGYSVFSFITPPNLTTQALNSQNMKKNYKSTSTVIIMMKVATQQLVHKVC